ncbi:hypothetical protein FRC01_003880, partial [Tulasnella sp. 417]
MNRRDSTRSTVGTVSSTRSRPETPELSDTNSSPKTSFESHGPYSPPLQLALSTPALASPIPPSPSSTPAHPAIFPKRPNPPISHSSPNLLGSLPTAPVDTATQSHKQAPREGRVTFPSTVRMSKRMTMSRFSGFDPRSSTYQFIRSAIRFSDPHLPDLKFLDGLENGAVQVEVEPGMDGAEDGPEYGDEENKEEITTARNQSGNRRSKSLSAAFMKTLSEASRGALAVFGTGGSGFEDARHSLPKNHQRSTSTPHHVIGQQEEKDEAKKERLADLREETMTDDGLGDDAHQVIAHEGEGIPADPMAQAHPTSPTFPTSPTSSLSPAHPRAKRGLSLGLLSLISRPPLINQRAAPPPPIKIPVPPQNLTITATGPSPLDGVPPSIACPVPLPRADVQLSPSTLIRLRATCHGSPSNGSAANSAATPSFKSNRSYASASISPKSPHVPLTPSPLPWPLPVQQQAQSPVTPQSPRLGFPARGTGPEISVAGTTTVSRRRYIGSTRVDKSLAELRQRLKLPGKKDSSGVHDDEPVAKLLEPESPGCTFPVNSTAAVLGGPDTAAPNGFQVLGGTGIMRHPISSSNPSENEPPDESIQILAPKAILPRPAAAPLPPSARDDELSDLGNHRLTLPAQGFQSVPSPQSDTSPEGLNSNFTCPPRASSTPCGDKEDPTTMMVGSLSPDTSKSSEFEEESDRNQGTQTYEVFLQPTPQNPHATGLASLPGYPASTLVGGLKENQEATLALTESKVVNEVETIVRSALEDVTHLSVPPSRLTIIPNTEIGWGKYGEVVQAILDGSSQTPVHVAVKELRNVGTRDGRGRIALRLARELKIWAKVNHPNILPLIGYHLSENYEIAQFISPFMTNGNVTQYFESVQVDLAKRLDITNILINDSLHAVLGDFGLASLMQDSDTSSGLTTSRTAKGSLRYMSPELHLEDDARPTLASDVWAWGCTAFEVVTGRLPYHEATKDAKILLAIAQEHQPPGSIKSLMSQLMESNSVDTLPVLYGLPYYL